MAGWVVFCPTLTHNLPNGGDMVTKEQAMKCHTFHHWKEKNADGTPVRCRATGKCKTWKTRPDDFRLPVKYGLRHSFYITPANAHEWEAIESEKVDVKVPITLKEIIESSPVHAERITAFANYWAESRVFPVVLLNYLVDECGAEHPEWDLRPLLARLQWFVEMHPRRILMPYINMGESDKECPVYPMTLSDIDNVKIETWQFRISSERKSHYYFTDPLSGGTANGIPRDVVNDPDKYKNGACSIVMAETPGECFFKLFMEM